MVAAVQGPDRRVIAVQVTFLKPDGTGKAPVSSPRKTFGKLGSGAVRLGPAEPILGIAEGVESGLSAMQIHGFPVWCGLGSTRLQNVQIPLDVRHLITVTDRDKAGFAAAKELQERHKFVRHLDYKYPPPPAKDWNEFLTSATERKRPCMV
jgi:hypothetical protein